MCMWVTQDYEFYKLPFLIIFYQVHSWFQFPRHVKQSYEIRHKYTFLSSVHYSLEYFLKIIYYGAVYRLFPTLPCKQIKLEQTSMKTLKFKHLDEMFWMLWLVVYILTLLNLDHLNIQLIWLKYKNGQPLNFCNSNGMLSNQLYKQQNLIFILSTDFYALFDL